MKKLIDFLSWIGVGFTILSIIVTLLASYQWINLCNMGFLKNFSSYSALQSAIFYTMLFWGIRLYNSNTGSRKIIYVSICTFFAASVIFLRFYGRVW